MGSLAAAAQQRMLLEAQQRFLGLQMPNRGHQSMNQPTGHSGAVQQPLTMADPNNMPPELSPVPVVNKNTKCQPNENGFFADINNGCRGPYIAVRIAVLFVQYTYLINI